MKLKGANGFDCGMDNLFFAEISHMQGEVDWVISCCCEIKPNANGNISSYFNLTTIGCLWSAVAA